MRKRDHGRRRHREERPLRGSQGRWVQKTVLILTDGSMTERQYFLDLKREAAVEERFSVTVKAKKGKSPEDVVKAVNNKKYDLTFCVLDVEGHESDHPGRRASIAKTTDPAREKGIVLCLSNPSFEVWFLAHFEKTAKQFKDADAVISRLNKYWLEHFKQDYDKSADGVYRRLSGRTKTAVANAKWVREEHHKGKPDTVDCNSSTDVYKLVEQLLSPE